MISLLLDIVINKHACIPLNNMNNVPLTAFQKSHVPERLDLVNVHVVS